MPQRFPAYGSVRYFQVNRGVYRNNLFLRGTSTARSLPGMEASVPLYRCYFIADNDTTTMWRTFYKSDDEAAHGHALDLFAATPVSSKIEVWEGTRLVLSYVRPLPETAVEFRKLSALALAAANDEIDPEYKRSITAYAKYLKHEAEALEWSVIR